MTDAEPVIIDCDPGHDDAIALLLTLASPEIDLQGITTVSGNHTVERTTANALRILDYLEQGGIPVTPGSPQPLIRASYLVTDVHGESGLDGSDLPEPIQQPSPGHAIDWIARTVERSPTPVTIVALGPLTNIGLFLIRYPDLASQLRRIVLMGGAIAEGNMTPAAEFNIWVDPEAAHRVFASEVDVTMVGLDVTRHALFTPDDIDRFAAGGRAGRLIAKLTASYLEFHRRHYHVAAAPIHDPVVVAHLLDSQLLETEHCAVRVDTGPEPSRGRTYVDRWGDTSWERNSEVAVGIDVARFRDLLFTRIERFDHHS